MRKAIVLLFALLVAGCAAKLPDNAQLAVTVPTQDSGVYPVGTRAVLKGHDGRTSQAVVVFRIDGEPGVEIPNIVPVQEAVAEPVVAGFRQQGVSFEPDAPVYLEVQINELHVVVTKPGLLYVATADSRVAMTVRNGKGSFTKKYKRQTSSESATRPEVVELETMLNEQLADIVAQILQDSEIRQMIRGN